MNSNLLLVPVDFSPTGEAALDAAASLARGSGGKLLVIHVRETQVIVGGAGEMYPLPETSDEELLARLRTLVAPYAGIPCEVRLFDGPAVDVIVATAETEKADMIVLGTHGRRGLARVLMGSVAEGVMRRAKCPVLAVKAHLPLTVPTE